MSTFLKGALVGGGITAASLFGYVIGTTAHAQQAKPQSVCSVDVGFGELTGGTQCFSGQVMVGTENGDLLCANLSVTCN